MTTRELALALGVPEETLTAKADIISQFDQSMSAAATEAQRKLEEAQNLDRIVNDNIAKFGMTEANTAQLQASNAALKAALDSVKAQGFNGITIPDLPSITPAAKDPMDSLRETIVNGFASVGQTLGVSTRYQRVFGQPLPDDPATLAQEAQSRRLSVADWAEQKYGITAKETAVNTEREQKRMDDYAAAAVTKYKETNPSVAGHPELNGGMPSGYPNIPKPRDTKSVREFSSMSAREKIASAMTRANEFGKSTSGAV